jgi:hypothetical protein
VVERGNSNVSLNFQKRKTAKTNLTGLLSIAPKLVYFKMVLWDINFRDINAIYADIWQIV